METNLQKRGLVHCVPSAKSRERLQEFFQRVYACSFVNKIVTYLNLFACPFKQRGISVMARALNFFL